MVTVARRSIVQLAPLQTMVMPGLNWICCFLAVLILNLCESQELDGQTRRQTPESANFGRGALSQVPRLLDMIRRTGAWCLCGNQTPHIPSHSSCQSDN